MNNSLDKFKQDILKYFRGVRTECGKITWPEKNQVIVGKESEIYSTEMLVNEINLLLVDEIKGKMPVLVKTRYSAKEDKATIEMVGDDLIKVCFEKPTARVTPGQSAVFYIDDIVLGGGKIISAK